jgi:hypothetical protein
MHNTPFNSENVAFHSAELPVYTSTYIPPLGAVANDGDAVGTNSSSANLFQDPNFQPTDITQEGRATYNALETGQDFTATGQLSVYSGQAKRLLFTQCELDSLGRVQPSNMQFLIQQGSAIAVANKDGGSLGGTRTRENAIQQAINDKTIVKIQGNQQKITSLDLSVSAGVTYPPPEYRTNPIPNVLDILQPSTPQVVQTTQGQPLRRQAKVPRVQARVEENQPAPSDIQRFRDTVNEFFPGGVQSPVSSSSRMKFTHNERQILVEECLTRAERLLSFSPRGGEDANISKALKCYMENKNGAKTRVDNKLMALNANLFPDRDFIPNTQTMHPEGLAAHKALETGERFTASGRLTLDSADPTLLHFTQSELVGHGRQQSNMQFLIKRKSAVDVAEKAGVSSWSSRETREAVIEQAIQEKIPIKIEGNQKQIKLLDLTDVTYYRPLSKPGQGASTNESAQSQTHSTQLQRQSRTTRRGGR